MRIGPIELASPVVLAPMAGVTNVAFRTLCRELERELVGTVSGLYVCEMVTARALVERHPATMHMTTFAPDESPRSLQLYTVDPATTYAAAKMIANEGLADHIDMNFGCPVPKVTKRGGGSALPYKRRLFGQIVAAAVRATQGTEIPVTVKFRIGIDEEHHTHLDAGRIAEAEGAAAVALHARTAAQRYSGTADWEQIALLKQQVRTIPVLGNGDIYDASDALTMMAATGCDGVVIGRGCLGRPWLFAELSAAFTGSPPPTPPTLGQVADIVRRHGRLLAAHFGEDKGMRDIRKHIAWYLHGFPAGSELRRALAIVKTLDELDRLLDRLDGSVPFPDEATGPGAAGFTRPGGAAGGLARRPGRLHGAGRRRRHALRRLSHRAESRPDRELSTMWALLHAHGWRMRLARTGRTRRKGWHQRRHRGCGAALRARQHADVCIRASEAGRT
ncbi:TIM-barrel, nifR3 family protein [Mycobacterium avium subsp. avium 2285 (R)]|nr:TIM-barrel, nifR3 family protein [Mycobacterium avium subsp. avium 2285 (R)]